MKKHTYTIEQVKDLIIWAKEQKIQAISIGDVGVTFSPMAFYEEPLKPSNLEVRPENSIDEDEESLLFHSAR